MKKTNKAIIKRLIGMLRQIDGEILAEIERLITGYLRMRSFQKEPEHFESAIQFFRGQGE